MEGIDLLEFFCYTANDRIPERASYSVNQFIKSNLR